MPNYVTYLIENCLVIARLMLDHTILLHTFISFENQKCMEHLLKEKNDIEDYLSRLLEFSNEKVTVDFINRELIITDFTVLLMEKTCGLYKMHRNPTICKLCSNLKPKRTPTYTEEEIIVARNFGYELLEKANKSLEHLYHIQKENLDGRLTAYFDNDYIHHVISETDVFIYTLEFLVAKISLTPTYIYSCNFYYNSFLQFDADYIKKIISPIQAIYSEEVTEFVSTFNQLMDDYNNEVNPVTMTDLSKSLKSAAIQFVGYNTELLKNILHNKYYYASIPLFHDHTLREANYVIYQLDTFEKL